MNTMPSLAAVEPGFNFQHPPIYDATAPPERTRVVVFGSFLGGYHALNELLSDELAELVTVVGVATDDPTQPFTHPDKRLWKYPHTREDELLVKRSAESEGIPVYTGQVKDEAFFRTVLCDWKPDLCLMATFGQKIPQAILNSPRLGFYNFHHSDAVWPSYPGPDPIAAMVRDGKTHLVLTMHEVTDVIDGGRFVARSHKIAIPKGANAVTMHRITWPQMGPFIRRQVRDILETEVAAQIH